MDRVKLMLTDRGYTDTKECKVPFEGSSGLIATRKDKLTLVVWLHNSIKVNKETILTINKIEEQYNISKTIIISVNKCSYAKGRLFEGFRPSFFLINRSDHKLMPNITLLNSNEAQSVINKYTKEALPKLLKSDPMVIWYAAKSGDIFKVEHTTRLGREYRVVI